MFYDAFGKNSNILSSNIQSVLTHMPIIHFNFWRFLLQISNHCYFQTCLSKYVTGIHTFKVSIVWFFSKFIKIYILKVVGFETMLVSYNVTG